jgi:hypothetical protein
VDAKYRTLVYRIQNGKTPVISRNLKKPWHKLSLQTHSFDQLIATYQPKTFFADIYHSNQGNYLSLRFEAIRADEIVRALLKQEAKFGQWLIDCCLPPNREGIENSKVQRWFSGNDSLHLYLLNDGIDEFPVGLFETLGDLPLIMGFKLHYHYVKTQILLSLDLELSTQKPWIEAQQILTSGRDPSLSWLADNCQALDMMPPRPMIRYTTSAK